MSHNLKAASIAAFIMSAFAALVASDATFATGAQAAGTLAKSQMESVNASNLTVESIVVNPNSTTTSTPVPHAADDRVATTQAVLNIDPQVRALPAMPAPNVETQSLSLNALVDAQPLPDTLDPETRCLAGAVYFEAKSESLLGQLAVARVIINRRESGRFASSLCGVVYQPSQFSFVRGRTMPNIPTTSRDWREAVAIAQIAIKDAWDCPAEGALFFHASHVSPRWNRTRLASIDNHIFYR